MTRLVLLLALFLPAAAAAQQKEGFPSDSPDSWRVAGTAKIFCSAIFVSGRDSAEARSHLTSYFLGASVDSISALEIDRARKRVRLTVSNRITREARQYGDQGCVIHQPGRDTVHFAPVRVTTALPGASTLPWPMGDVLPATPLPPGIDTAKVRQATDAAFANPAGLTARRRYADVRLWVRWPPPRSGSSATRCPGTSSPAKGSTSTRRTIWRLCASCSRIRW